MLKIGGVGIGAWIEGWTGFSFQMTVSSRSMAMDFLPSIMVAIRDFNAAHPSTSL